VSVCAKVVLRLNEHDGVIEWKFMKIAPPRNKELVAPLFQDICNRDHNRDYLQCNRNRTRLHCDFVYL